MTVTETLRLDAMISSTSRDLPDYRKEATDSLFRSGFYPVVMENLTATSDEDAISISLKMVNDAEVYIGIFGHRYGHIVEDDPRNPDRLSVTELEYRRAKELGMPILIFIMKDDHPPAPDTTGKPFLEAKAIMDDFEQTYYETSAEGKAKLNALKDELGTNHIVRFFTTPEDLRYNLTLAINSDELKKRATEYYFQRDPSISVDKPNLPKTTDTGIPHPPDLYALPVYSDGAAPFVGRKKELAQLNQWIKPESDKPMLIFEAIGGMGKSALTWAWLQDHLVADDVQGTFWFSFYEGGSDMSAFIVHLLAYVTERTPEKFAGRQVMEMVNELMPILKENRYLVVLDGLERVLVAYHRWDASQMQDYNIVGTDVLRSVTNPRDATILRLLVQCTKSRFLVTSRLMPYQLQKVNRSPLNGVQHLRLDGLSLDDAKLLLEEWDITWEDEKQLDQFLQSFGRHSLIIKLVVGQISQDYRSAMSFDKWYARYGKGFDVYKDAKAKRNHILQVAYRDLSPEAKKLLSHIALLGDSADLETIDVFNPYLPEAPSHVEEPDVDISWEINELREELEQVSDDTRKAEIDARIAELEAKDAEYQAYQDAIHLYEADIEKNKDELEAKLDKLLRELENRGLLWWKRDTNVYDLHPVVRGYASNMLGADARIAGYDRMFNYFERQEGSAKDEDEMTLEDLQPSIKMYQALFGAGKYNTAMEFYSRNIEEILQYILGNQHLAHQLLQALLLDEDGQRLLITGNRISGYVEQYLYSLSIIGSEKTFDTLFNRYMIAMRTLGSHRYPFEQYALYLTNCNKLYRGVQFARIAFETSDYRTLSSAELGFNTTEISNILIREFYLPRQIKSAFYNNQDLKVLISEFYGLDSIQKGRYSVPIRDVKLIEGEGALQEGRPQDAVTHFSKCIQLCNEIGASRVAIVSGQAFGGLARAYLELGNTQEAENLLTESLDDYSAALVMRVLNRPDEAEKHALAYLTWAWADGEPYVHRWHLNRARDLLKEMNITEPELPPFNPDNYPPIPGELALREHFKDDPAKLERWFGEDFDLEQFLLKGHPDE